MARIGGEHVVDILAERYLRAESIHQIGRSIVVRAASSNALQPNIAVTIISLRLGTRELVEVWRVLIMLTAASISHRVSL